MGNRTWQSRNGEQSYFEYDVCNALTRQHALTGDAWTYFAYDTQGNCEQIQETGGTTYFEYNGNNLVTQIKYPDNTMNYFWYDAKQRRYAVQDSDGLSYFTWDRNGMNLLLERDSTGAVTADYTHGYTPIGGIGSLVGAKKVEGGHAYYQYPIKDHRGTVVAILDETGTQKEDLAYDAWGQILKEIRTAPYAANRFGYQSNWITLKDSNGQLCLSPTRIYHADLGRFLQRDPVGMHLEDYRYTISKPVNKVDPRGLTPTHAAECICGPDITSWFFARIYLNRRWIATKLPLFMKEVKEQLDSDGAGFLGSIIKEAKAWVKFFEALVKGDGPWDYKKPLLAMNAESTKKNGCPTKTPVDCSTGVTLLGQCIQYENISNIHFGIVGLDFGLPKEILLWGAGVAQQGGGLWGIVMADIAGEAKSWGDEPEDAAAIQVGFLIHNLDPVNAWLDEDPTPHFLPRSDVARLIKKGLKPGSMNVGGGNTSGMKLVDPGCEPCRVVGRPKIEQPNGWILKNGEFQGLTIAGKS